MLRLVIEQQVQQSVPPSPKGSFILQSKSISRYTTEGHMTQPPGNTQCEREPKPTHHFLPTYRRVYPSFAIRHFHSISMVIPYPKKALSGI